MTPGANAVLTMSPRQGYSPRPFQCSVPARHPPNRGLLPGPVCGRDLREAEAFRGSDRFPRWRALIGPFFDGDPHVEHWVDV
jgi:hypothetical protein